MSVYIPCLNPDRPDNGGGFSVSAGVGLTGEGGTTPTPGISFTHSDSPVSLTIIPVPPFIWFGPNFAFWSDLFGLGETRIEREKEQIQDVLTSILRYLQRSYGVPLRDNHALQFQSDGVQAQFARRPDIAALVPTLHLSSETMTRFVFASSDTSQGQRERVVNQFLANAAINDWPPSAALAIWNGMLDAANPNCASDPERWMKNPAIVVTAAELAVMLQYIPLPVLTNMAVNQAVGDEMARRLILQWAENPELVKTIPFREQYDWQPIYIRNEWALPPYRYPLGGTIPLYQRQHIKDLIAGVQVLRPRYPDFTNPPPGGIQGPTPRPTPQPEPTPNPTPQPDPTPNPQPDPTPTPQPDPDPRTQPPPEGYDPQADPNNDPNRTPSEEDYRYACQMMRKLASGGALTDLESRWLLTRVGGIAVAWASNNPACADPATGQQPNPPGGNQEDCTPEQLWRSLPDWWPWLLPQPQPFPGQGTGTPQRDGVCDPDCQIQIDLARAENKETKDRVDLWLMPRIHNLEWWITDIERRLPGPRPPVPYPDVIPPQAIPDPPDPEPPGGEENPPGEEEPPALTPEEVLCLKKFCDPEHWCDRTKQCERELECVRIPLCDPQGGPWGGMTECWHDHNQTPERDVFGVYRQTNLQTSFTDLYRRGYHQAFRIQGQQSGPAQSQTFDPRDPARWDSISNKLAQQFVNDWKAGTFTQQRQSVSIPSRPWIFADPTTTDLGQVKIRQPKLRPGEVDPCSVEPGQVLEIPPVNN